MAAKAKQPIKTRPCIAIVTPLALLATLTIWLAIPAWSFASPTANTHRNTKQASTQANTETPTTVADLTVIRKKIDARFLAQLNRLADKCDELEMKEQARITRDWFVPRLPDRLTLFLIPGGAWLGDPKNPKKGNADSPPPPLPANASRQVQQWHRKWLEYRKDHAKLLFKLAKKEIAAHHVTTAYRLLYEVLHENPDHTEARHVLGYRRVRGVWRQPGSIYRVQRCKTRHPKLGWPANSYWRIQTAHFEIVTNRSAQEGERLAQKLEDLHAVWRQLFVRYWTSEATQATHFQGRRSTISTRRMHKVVLFRNRDEYIAHLVKTEPQIAMSLGYYSQGLRTAFFYAGDASVEATWFHEGTHQLFYENRYGPKDVGRRRNFWIVEAVALVMESMQRDDRGYYTVGGVEAERLQYARNRTLSGGFYVPLQELTAMGRVTMQQDKRIHPLYSQSAGLGHFLMIYDHGRYYEPLVDYLKAVYQGRDRKNSLEQKTGTPLKKLDTQYRDFLNVTDAQLKQIPKTAHPKKLALGHTSITDAGLLALPDLSQLDWLDLSFTQVTDAGIARLAQSKKLTDLGLESTPITDAALPFLSKLPNLKELDLSNTKITDTGAKHLSQLKNLKTLWLTKTSITDATLTQLQSLKHLNYLNISKTKATQEGYQKLKQALPKLNQE